jgi:hypothetical protein
MSKMKKKSKLQQYMTNFFRLLSLAMIPIAASVPSVSVLHFVACNNVDLQSIINVYNFLWNLAHCAVKN